MVPRKTILVGPARVDPQDTALEVWSHGANTGVLCLGGHALLIGGASDEVLSRAGLSPGDVDWVLVTHAFRSAAESLYVLAAVGASIGVPAAERDLFSDVEAFWASDTWRRHAYHYHPAPRAPLLSVQVRRGFAEGDVLEWEGLRIECLETPGPTDGGVTYLVEVGGLKVAFTGDLIAAPGKLWEMHSLQGTLALPNGGEMGEYHAFGARAERVLASLDRVLAREPDVLVPSRGEIIHQPREAVAALRENLAAAMASYYEISSACWHFGFVPPQRKDGADAMRSRLRPIPSWVREPGMTTRAVVADDGAMFPLDCCGEMPTVIRDLQREEGLGPVEALWVTHYHDDHVGSINALREEQGTQVIGHHTMADILVNPEAYLLPCLDPIPVKVDRVTRHSESWQWKGFTFTAYDFPGQSIYDAALLVERGEERVLFIGDSLSPAGIDDYCAHNRNLVGPGLGFDRCLALLEEIDADCPLINEHIPGAFSFTATELAAMRASLEKRRDVFARLFPWDDPNYGLDPQWCRTYPYYQVARPGATVAFDVCVRNYSSVGHAATAELELPPGWRLVSAPESVRVPPGGERRMRVEARSSRSTTGRQVIGTRLRFGRLRLLGIAEAIVEMQPSNSSP